MRMKEIRCAHCGYENDRAAKRCSMCDEKMVKKNPFGSQNKKHQQPNSNRHRATESKTQESKKSNWVNWIEKHFVDVILEFVLSFLDF